jgi:NitT/TauT family transport system permease protein
MGAGESRPGPVITALRAAVLAAILSAWEMGARTGALDRFFFSSPSEIGLDLISLFATGKVYPHLLMTLKEVGIGLALGTISGLAVGIVLGKYETLARVLDPVLMGLYAVPKVAVAPLFILWFGLGIAGKIVFVWVVVFFLVFFNAYAGMRNVRPELVESVRMMGANEWQVLVRVSLPSCLPWLMVGLRASLGAGLVAAIVGELIAADTGLGHLIMEGVTLFMTRRVLAVVVVISALVIALDAGLRLLERRFLRWNAGQRR